MTIYLDNSATTRVRDEVLLEMTDVLKNEYGNPSSLHRMGLNIEKRIEAARKNIASLINCGENEILFTSGGTESNNLAINSHVSKLNKGSNIVTTSIEHPSVYNIYKQYEKRGYDVRYLDTDKQGFIDFESLKKLVDINTGLISIIYVNNEIGTIQKLNEIIKHVKEINSNTRIHIDAIQALGKLSINMKKLNVDTMSLSAHKVHGPKGVGALYINSKTNIEAFMYGGYQEKGIRPGTENTSGIIGFGKACELLKKDFNDEIKRLNLLKLAYADKLREKIEDISINSILGEEGTAHILNVSFKAVKAEVLVHYLENYGIYVSTGAACSSKQKVENRTLNAIKLDDKFIEGTIRISFGYFNSIEELDYTVDKIKECVEDIRKIITVRR